MKTNDSNQSNILHSKSFFLTYILFQKIANLSREKELWAKLIFLFFLTFHFVDLKVGKKSKQNDKKAKHAFWLSK